MKKLFLISSLMFLTTSAFASLEANQALGHLGLGRITIISFDAKEITLVKQRDGRKISVNADMITTIDEICDPRSIKPVGESKVYCITMERWSRI